MTQWQPPRRRTPYPSHLVRFPSQMFTGSRRGRGLSVFRVVYLGTHPVALLLSLFIYLLLIEFVLAWVVLVVTAWALWAAAVSVLWLCQSAASAVRR